LGIFNKITGAWKKLSKKVFSLLLAAGLLFNSNIASGLNAEGIKCNLIKAKNKAINFVSNNKVATAGGAVGLPIAAAAALGIRIYGNSQLFPFAFASEKLDVSEIKGETTVSISYNDNSSTKRSVSASREYIEIGNLRGCKYTPSSSSNKYLKGKCVIVYGPNSYSVQELVQKRCPAIGKLLDNGATVVALDYRGYGYSHMAAAKVRISEGTIYKDGEKVYKYVNKNLNFKPQNIIAFGYSLGGSVASHVAAYASSKKDGLCGLILASPINSFYKVASQDHFKPIVAVAETAMLTSLNTLKNLSKIKNNKDIILYLCSGDRGDDYLSIKSSGVNKQVKDLNFKQRKDIICNCKHGEIERMFGPNFDGYIKLLGESK